MHECMYVFVHVPTNECMYVCLFATSILHRVALCICLFIDSFVRSTRLEFKVPQSVHELVTVESCSKSYAIGSGLDKGLKCYARGNEAPETQEMAPPKCLKHNAIS